MLRTPKQRLTGLMQWVERKGLFQNLRGCVEIPAIQRQPGSYPSFELYLRPVCHRLVDVDVLSAKLVITAAEVNLVLEEIIEVHGAEREFPRHQVLLDPRFERPILLSSQIGVRF